MQFRAGHKNTFLRNDDFGFFSSRSLTMFSKLVCAFIRSFIVMGPTFWVLLCCRFRLEVEWTGRAVLLSPFSSSILMLTTDAEIMVVCLN